jgi:Zn-dependent protease with chaperone function/tetratricopeptide (TPR) repeat protein
MTAQAPRSSIPGEEPLGPAARAWLVANAAFTILLFYLTAMLFIAAFAVLALLLLFVALALARLGLASFVTRLLQVPVRLIGILGRRLWLSSGLTYRIALAPRDAPGLFEIARDVARRAGVAAPESIAIEMHVNAWVQMRGYRRGRGRTSLGIGFDLLAGLTVSEVEGVLAHELAHARLVQRGVSRWLKRGLARMGQVTNELSACAAAYRQASARSDLADATFKVFDSLTGRAARLVATYSRQDEFAADRGAVDLCSAAAVRSALRRLETLSEIVGALPWSERLARLQPGEAFTAWLVDELAPRGHGEAHLPLRHAVDPYSTHPGLRDRLAALPADESPLRDARPGIALLADPDTVASRLIVEIQRVVAVQEAKDSQHLARETRKFCRPQTMALAPVIGWVMLIFGVGFAFITIGDAFPFGLLVSTTALLTVGVKLARYRYEDTRPLPVPAFGTLTNPRPPETQEQLRVAEQAIATELRAAAERAAGADPKASWEMLVSTSYGALNDRDYLRAHVAARLALEMNQKSVEAGLGYAIAAAGLGNAQQMQTRLAGIRRKIGLRTEALKWGTAWALSLLNDWSSEGLLQQLHDDHPGIATYALLLALAQLNRGKLQSAIVNAERGVTLAPANRAGVYLLAQVLLLAGRTAEAAARLDPLEGEIRTDVNAAFLMVRLRLMQRDTARAIQWADVVRGLDQEGTYLIGLGHAFAAARLAEPAAACFKQAAEAQFKPEANIGLSVVAWQRGDRMQAKGHLLSALKFDGAKLTKGQTIGGLFHEILGRLNGLAEQRLACRAWIATVPEGGSLALAGRSILVCAQSEAAARLHFETIVNAMQGGPSDLSRVSWRTAPKEQQPERPVPPGVHTVVA